MIRKENKDWYVLQTRSRHEKKTHALLTRFNIESYLPLVSRKKKWSDRIKIVEEPIFSGYMFVRFQEINRYQILNTPGVVRFVSFNGEYATIDSKEIDAIKALSAFETEKLVVDSTFFPGEEVLISFGLFKGINAKLVSYKGKDKILLEVKAIGKGVLLEIGKTKIEKIRQSVLI